MPAGGAHQGEKGGKGLVDGEAAVGQLWLIEALMMLQHQAEGIGWHISRQQQL